MVSSGDTAHVNNLITGMTNPFEYGRIVGKEAFCNRTKELRELKSAAENGDNLLVYAERRMGKTSLIKRVLADLPKKSFLPVYIDLWPTSDPTSFATTVAESILRATSTRAEKWLESTKDLFRHLVPALSLDEQGNPSIQFGARTGVKEEPQISDALEAPARLAKKRGLQVVLVYDEIQRITEFGSDLVERLLRSHVQTHENVSYFFLGSRKHVIQRMFMERGRPLYQSTGHYPLNAIAKEHWIPFIKTRFEAASKRIEEAIIEKLCDRTEGHPYYTQQLAHNLWEITASDSEVTDDTLDQAETILLERMEYSYTVLWDSLTINQRQFLKGIAVENSDLSPFSSEFLKKVGLSPSSAHRAAESIEEDDLIDREGNGFVIRDRFFRRWIQRM